MDVKNPIQFQQELAACCKRLEGVAKGCGGRVVTLKVMEQFKQYRKKQLFVHCFDDRYAPAIRKFVEMHCRGLDRSERVEALKLPLPGAGLELMNESPYGREWLLTDLFQWALENQLAGVINWISHTDCGVYGGSQAFGHDSHQELVFHENELLKAKESVTSRFPGVVVNLHVVRFVNQASGHNAEFEVIPVGGTPGEIVRLQAKFNATHQAKTLVVGSPDTMVQKAIYDMFIKFGASFQLSLPGGASFMNDCTSKELKRALLDVPIRKAGIEEVELLSFPKPDKYFVTLPEKLSFYIQQGNIARHVVRDLYQDKLALNIRPIFGHTFTIEGVPVVAYIES